jgi:hypothetical protein
MQTEIGTNPVIRICVPSGFELSARRLIINARKKPCFEISGGLEIHSGRERYDPLW